MAKLVYITEKEDRLDFTYMYIYNERSLSNNLLPYVLWHACMQMSLNIHTRSLALVDSVEMMSLVSFTRGVPMKVLPYSSPWRRLCLRVVR